MTGCIEDKTSLNFKLMKRFVHLTKVSHKNIQIDLFMITNVVKQRTKYQ